jgi:hypothetical protein
VLIGYLRKEKKIGSYSSLTKIFFGESILVTEK